MNKVNSQEVTFLYIFIGHTLNEKCVLQYEIRNPVGKGNKYKYKYQ